MGINDHPSLRTASVQIICSAKNGVLKEPSTIDRIQVTDLSISHLGVFLRRPFIARSRKIGMIKPRSLAGNLPGSGASHEI